MSQLKSTGNKSKRDHILFLLTEEQRVVVEKMPTAATVMDDLDNGMQARPQAEHLKAHQFQSFDEDDFVSRLLPVERAWGNCTLPGSTTWYATGPEHGRHLAKSLHVAPGKRNTS